MRRNQCPQGAGAAHIPAAVAAQVAMHTPCTALQPAGAEVNHAYHPTGPVVPATKPAAAWNKQSLHRILV